MENVEDIYALSPVQEGILFHCISAPRSGVYHEQFTCRLIGDLDVSLFEAAWRRVFARHPALRTIFLWEDIDEPLQIVRQQVTLPWRHEDWREEPELAARLHRFLQDDRRTGIDLTNAPLSRMLLVRESVTSWRFVWSFHHIMLDGWSTPLVVREALAAYQALRAGREPEGPASPPFRDYIAWLQSRNRDHEKAFWRQRLAGFEETNHLRFYDSSPGGPGSHRRSLELSSELTAQLRAVAHQHRLTLNTLLHGAWALLLHACTGQDDLVFGSTVSGRPAELPGIEHMVGCCINTLPLRVRFDPARKPADWLAELQTEHIAIREFEGSSLAAIQSWSETPPGTSLFESIVVFENYPVSFTSAGDSEGLPVSDLDVHEQSNFPLALLVIPDHERLRMMLAYDGALFAATTIGCLLERLQVILESLVSAPTTRLGDLNFLGRKEARDLAAWSEGPALQCRPELAPALIARHAANRPTQPAIIFNSKEVSWQEVDQRSEAVAAALQEKGIAPGQCVSLCIERSVEMVIGIVGILKAGCSYLPLDPNYPRARLAFILEDSGATILLSRSGLLPDLAATARLDFEEVEAAGTAEPVVIPAQPDHLAYLIYTSGSTGRPKGVGVTHANLAASLAARQQYYRRPPERFLLLSSFSFDSSIAGILWTLCSGGTIVLPRDKEEQDMEVLAGLINRHSVSHTLCLPSLYALLLEYAPAKSLQSLRVAMMAGEECPAAVCEKHHALLPNCELHNEYGPTEATVWCTAWQSDPTHLTARVPIGKPIPGYRVHLLDSHRRPVPIGVPGELCVGGAGVTPGYLHDTDRTAKSFIPDPFKPGERLYRTGDLATWLPDGNLLFLGRADGQVKVRGHRLELGELEAALATHPAVAQSATLVTHPPDPDDIDSLAEALEKLAPEAADQLLAEITV